MSAKTRFERSHNGDLRLLGQFAGKIWLFQVRNPETAGGNREDRKLFPYLILCFYRAIAQLVTGNFLYPECVQTVTRWNGTTGS